MALIWAAGIIWVAYDIAESAPKSSPTGNSAADQATADDTNKVAEVFNGL